AMGIPVALIQGKVAMSGLHLAPVRPTFVPPHFSLPLTPGAAVPPFLAPMPSPNPSVPAILTPSGYQHPHSPLPAPLSCVPASSVPRSVNAPSSTQGVNTSVMGGPVIPLAVEGIWSRRAVQAVAQPLQPVVVREVRPIAIALALDPG
ncbi:benzoate/H(+) symporter BenE family transporter, partial [Salmonella enterica]|uniref:benzoate/H(+) symporter BenE family transporter n=1 Tax=Salmonella enterica TaxID=28901 RepID=UPI00398C3F8B